MYDINKYLIHEILGKNFYAEVTAELFEIEMIHCHIIKMWFTGL